MLQWCILLLHPERATLRCPPIVHAYDLPAAIVSNNNEVCLLCWSCIAAAFWNNNP